MYIMAVYNHDVLLEVPVNPVTIYLMDTLGRRLLCLYHPVTIYQLLTIKCATVVEGTIFIMSLDRCSCGACLDASWLKSRLYDLLRTWH